MQALLEERLPDAYTPRYAGRLGARTSAHSGDQGDNFMRDAAWAPGCVVARALWQLCNVGVFNGKEFE